MTNSKTTAMEFHEVFMKLKKIMKNNSLRNSAEKSTDQQFRTLMELKAHGNTYLKELSHHIGVSNSSLCIMLNKMCEEGFVSRKTDEKDRRNTIYFLTEKGFSFVEEERGKRMQASEMVFNKLSPNKKEKLYESIKMINEILDDLL